MSDSDSDMMEEGPDPNTASMFGDEPASDDGAYQVLARKYRPVSFDDMVGQEAMVRTLKNAFKTGRIAHAFMLTGVRGVGKTTTARLLARALNYDSDHHEGPSIVLSPRGRHCQAIMESRHPDILELDAASRTGVADMRELLDGVRYAPVNARYKVYIIDEVHMLSTAAFNALLKTLEEPPPHVKFIFATTEIRKVPVTVLSRCQRFNLQRLTSDALAKHLGRICEKEGAKVSEEGLMLVARAAEGSARDALSILDQAIVQATDGEVTAELIRDMLGLADRERIFDLLDAAIEARHKDALHEVDAQIREGAEAQVLLKDLLDVMAEVARAQALGEDYQFSGPTEWTRRIQKLAGAMTAAQAARYWKLLLQGFEDCGRAPDPGVSAEMTILRLAAAASLPSPEDAARMLAGAPSNGGGAIGGPSAPTGGGQGPRASYSENVARAIQPEIDVDPDAPGPRLSSFGQICAALQTDKQINLLYDVEHFVRPANIVYGRFAYAPAPGVPNDFQMRLKGWLEDKTGVEWHVETAPSDKESLAEKRAREQAERVAEVSRHPRISEALKQLPGAKVVKIEKLDRDEDGNVVRVDFSRQRDFSSLDEHEDEDY